MMRLKKRKFKGQEMKKMLIFVLLLSGCKIVSNGDQLIAELDYCKREFKEDCSLVAVPNSFDLEHIRKKITENNP